jgi:PPK2 family polyphosphate:nucleotide phosphotransferase
MDLQQRLIVPPGTGKPFRLKDRHADDAEQFIDKRAAQKRVDQHVKLLSELHYRLYAENRRSLLIILQGMDTSGKDGTIRHVMSGFDPQGCRVVAFKKPTDAEADHDFLWRIHEASPGRGEVAIFNRSHYEDVLVTRVHGTIDEAECRRRYAQINTFEQYLVDHGTVVLKFMLHISKEEQRERLLERLNDPRKHWKFAAQDIAERALWDKYQQVYASALGECSTPHAPWYVIPSDKKWFRNFAVAEIVAETLQGLNPQFPKPVVDVASFIKQLGSSDERSRSTPRSAPKR